MHKLPTIYDVAREAGVSLATVSRVINKSESVRPATKKRVEMIIEKLNYRPNSTAKSLATSKSTTIALVLPTLDHFFYSELAQGVDAVAKMYGFSVIVIIIGDEKNKEDEFESVFDKNIEGVIYLGTPNKDFEKSARKREIPIVYTGSISSDKQDLSVSIDYKTAFKQAAKKLISNKPALVISEENVKIAELEIAGFKEVIKNPKIFKASNYQDGYRIAEELVKDDIRSIISDNDLVAIGILNWLLDNGIKVPEDFQIITRDNTSNTENIRPMLSSIAQPKYDLGAVSMRLLTKAMQGETIKQNQIILNHDFIYRNTTK